MILYTEVPLDMVLEGLDNARTTYEEITVNGIMMQVEPVSAYQGKIVRLLSPDPMHYLNPAYAPGQLIEFKPV